MKQIIYNAQTKTETVIESNDKEQDEVQTLPSIEERITLVEEAALDLAELQSEMLYQLCLMEMGVNENDL